MRLRATRTNALAIGLSALVGGALVGFGMSDCATALAAGWDRTPRVFGPSDPVSPNQSWSAMLLAAVWCPALGVLVGAGGGSPRFGAGVAGLTLAGAAVASALLQPVLFPTAYYYFIPPVGVVAHYVVPLGVVLSVLWWAAAALGTAAMASLTRRWASARS